jgi:hypothetical protein
MIGVVGVLVAIPTGFILSTNNSVINLLLLLTFYAPGVWQFPIVFAFIDSIIPVLRRSDPLLRNILNWKKVRIGLWSVVALETILRIYEWSYFLYLPACWAATYIGECVRTSFAMINPGWPSAILGFFFFRWYFLTTPCFILGAVALLIGSRRSRDMVLRESVKWSGAALVCDIVGWSLVVAIISLLNWSYYYYTYSYGAVLGNAVAFLTGYAIYRSARSLAPLNRLPPIEAVITPSTKEAVS